MNIRKIVVLAALALSTFAAAQGMGGGRGGWMRGGMGGASVASRAILLMREDVTTELALTDDQKTKLSEMQAKLQEEMMGMFQGGGRPDREKMQGMFEDMAKRGLDEASKILTPEQNVRLKEIAIQEAGNAAAQDAEVAKVIGVTVDQKARMQDLQKKAEAAQRTMMERMRNGEMDREEMQPMMQKIRATTQEELGKILTPAQREKLKAMGGKPFKKAEETRS